ncbi:MAG: hypothetical protein ACRC33_17885, partial [Gemmataceae bacterium]
MFRLFSLALTLTVAAAWSAPLPFPKKRPNVLEGTTWVGTGIVTTPTTYRFERGGVLVSVESGHLYRDGTWKQDGEKVEWERNKRYCWFEGTFKADKMG